MKRGLILFFGGWAGLGFGYYYLLQGSEYSDQYWIGIVLGLAVITALANLWGLVSIFQKRRASSRPASQWKEGELVGTCGRIQAIKAPIIAPFSGKGAAILEYSIKRTRETQNGHSAMADCMGMSMTPCAVQTSAGPVRLIGFPLMAMLNEEEIESDEAFARAGEYLMTTQFKEKAKNPFALLKELNAILADDDGDLKVDFKESGFSLLDSEYDVDPDFDEDLEEDGEDEEDGVKGSEVSVPPEQPLLNASQVAERLKSGGYSLHETVIPNGTEVTVFGTYNATKRAINIGSGLKNLKHEIHLGKLQTVFTTQLKRTVITLVFWSAAAAAGNWILAKQLGYEVKWNQHSFFETLRSLR